MGVALDPASHRALLIGVDRYPDWGDLKGAESDIDDVEAWLLSTGVSPDRVTKLRSKDYRFTTARRARPVFQQVVDWLTGLEEEADGRPDDFPLGERVYLVFAGHGINHKEFQQTGLLPRSGPRFSDCLPLLSARTFLRTRAYFREVVVVADCCRDQVKLALTPSWPFGVETHRNSNQVSVFEVYAAEAGEKAIEQEFAPGKWGGVTTQALLRGLQGFAADDQGRVWAHTLKGYLIAAVVARLGQEFEPQVSAKEEEPSPMLLCQSARRRPTLRIVPKAHKTGLVTVTRKKDSETAGVALLGEPLEFVLDVGYYAVTAPDGSRQDVTLAWEETTVYV